MNPNSSMTGPADDAALRESAEKTLREGAAIGSISPRAQIAVAGPDRAAYLQGLLTNDIQALAEGSGCYAAWLSPQGRMLTDMHVLQSAGMLLLDVPAAQASAMLARLDQFLFSEDVRIESLVEAMTGVWVHGPQAAAVIERVDPRPRGSARTGRLPARHRDVRRQSRVGRADRSAGRSRLLRVPGPSDEERFVAAAVDAGARVVAAEALHAARIEAGYPLFGIDMTDDTIPLEAGIEQRAISFTKGCFVGQEVVIRVLHRGGGRVAKKLVGFKLTTPAEGHSVGHPFKGAKVFSGEREIGVLTSVATSPRFGPIALGYVHRDFTSAGHRRARRWSSRDSGRIADGVRFPASQPQFGVGRSIRSTTRTSAIPFARCSFKPSCSSSAFASDGPASCASSGASAHVKSMSNLPVRPVRSVTLVPTKPRSIVARPDSSAPPNENVRR